MGIHTVNIVQNDEDKGTEIWIDKKFQASWSTIKIPEEIEEIVGRIEAMFEHIYEKGIRKGKIDLGNHVKDVLGIKR